MKMPLFHPGPSSRLPARPFTNGFRIALLPVGSALIIFLLLVGPACLRAGAGGGFLEAGLRGEYFANENFSGSPAFIRRDDRIRFRPLADHSWAGSSGLPLAGFPTEHFSIRWTGRLRARFAEAYTFQAEANDRLTLSIKKSTDSVWITVINLTSTGTAAGALALEADVSYDVLVEFAQETGAARAVLSWSSPSVPLETIDPATHVGMNHIYREQTYADAFKAGRSSYGATGGGPIPGMDAQGWPTGDFEFVVSEWLTPCDISPLETGWNKVSFTGRATIGTFGQCRIADVNGDGQRNASDFTYDVATNTTSGFIEGYDTNSNVWNVRFTNTDRDGDYGGDGQPDKDGLTNIRIMRPTAPGATTSLPDGMFLHPKFREAMERLTSIRFTRTNDQAVLWSDRVPPYYGVTSKSLPYVYNSRYNNGNWNLTAGSQQSHEVEIQICNELGCDIYISVPHLATVNGPDSYIGKLARLLRYGSDAQGEPYSAPTAQPVYPPLLPHLNVYLEISNELWNFGAISSYAPYFDFRELIEDKADANDADFQLLNYDHLALTLDSGGYYNNNYTWVRRYWCLKLAQISDLFRGVFGDDEMPGNGHAFPRIRPYFTWQYGDSNATGSTGLKFMDAVLNNQAGNFVANPHPASYYFWCSGGAGYYSSGNKWGTVDNFIVNGSFESPVVTTPTPAPSGASWVFTGDAGIAPKATRTDAVTSATPGVTRNNFANWAGCRFTVGANPLTVYELGRWVFTGNTQSHEARIVRASDLAEVASATVATSGKTAGTFAYALCIPVTLQANTSYYLWAKENAAGDTCADETGNLTPTADWTVDFPATGVLTNNVWTVTPGSGAGHGAGPVSFRYAPAFPLEGGTTLNTPDPLIGTQCAWIHSRNGVSGALEYSFTAPASPLDTTYGLIFKWTKRTQTLRGTADNPSMKIYATVNGVQKVITPLDVSTQPQQWATANGWKRLNYWVGDYFFSENFTAPAGASVTVRFVDGASSGDHVTFLDEVILTSADAFYAAPIPTTGAAFGGVSRTYESSFLDDNKLSAAFGLRGMSYEHGFSAGGDAGNSPIQNYVKFYDPRARQTVVDALQIFERAGGIVPTFGTYSTWPSHESISGARVEGILDSSAFPLAQGIDEELGRLPPSPTNGSVIPGASLIAGTQRSHGTGSNASLAASQWNSYNLGVAAPGIYAIGVDTTSGGQVVLTLGAGTVPIASGASGSIVGGAVFLPWGLHAIHVRNTGAASFTINQILIDGASQPPPAPASLTASHDPATTAISLQWADQSNGVQQELWFEIERAADAGFATDVNRFTTTRDSTHWTDPALLPLNSTFYYRIRSYNLTGYSGWAVLNAGAGYFLPAPDSLLAEESFNYPANTPLQGSSGAGSFGWTGSWQVEGGATGGYVLTTANLSFGQLATQGQQISGGDAAKTCGRYFDTTGVFARVKRTDKSQIGKPGSELWFSYLQKLASAANRGKFSLDRDGGAVVHDNYGMVRVKNVSNQWTLSLLNDTVVQSTGIATDTAAHLFVLRIRFGSPSTVDLWLDPPLGSLANLPAPQATCSTTSDFYFGEVNWIPHGSPAGGWIDEIRVGYTYPSVTPRFPQAPASLLAFPGDGWVDLFWEAGSAAESYNVFSALDQAGPFTLRADNHSGTSLRVTGLANGIPCFFRVTSVNRYGESAVSPTVSATPTAVSGYEAWKNAHFSSADLTAGRGDPLATPAGDGIANLLKYALGIDTPLAPMNFALLPRPGFISQPDRLTLVFRRARPELTYLVEGSSDFLNWTTIATNPGQVGQETTVPDTQPIGGLRLLRLRLLAP